MTVGMKKILILANSDIVVYNFRKELIEELIHQGYEVYISLPYGILVDKLIKLGCKFIETPIDRRGINPLKDLKLVRNYSKIIDEVKPKCVLTYTIKPNIYGGFVCKSKKIPYITTITGLGSTFNHKFLKKFVTTLYKFSLNKSNCVFFQNESNLKIFVENNILKNVKYELVAGSGVNIKDFNFVEYPTESNGIIFNYVGRIMRDKGIEEYLYASKKIREKYNNVIFYIWGYIESTDAKYKEIIESYEKMGYVKYGGYVDSGFLKVHIANSHCTVLPSYNEGLANVLLESASIGRPLIASNIPGCKEVIENSKNGFTFNGDFKTV